MPGHDATHRYADLALSTWLDELVRDRRVLWLGDADGKATDRLAGSARSVLVLAPNPPPKRESTRRSARISALKPGPLSFRAGSFDVVVVPDVGSVGLDDTRVGELRDLLGDEGVLIAATPSDAGRGVGYDALYELLSDRFGTVRMVGQAPFAGHALVDLAAIESDYDVTFDGSLVGDEQAADRWVAVASADGVSVDSYCIVQLPAQGDAEQPLRAEGAGRRARRREPDAPVSAGETSVAERVSTLEEQLRVRHAEVDAANEHAEALERSLEDRNAEVSLLRARLDAHEQELDSLRAEIARYEERGSYGAATYLPRGRGAPAEGGSGDPAVDNEDAASRAEDEAGAHQTEPLRLELSEQRAELESLRGELEPLRAELSDRVRELESLRAERAHAATETLPGEDVAADYDRLERALAEQGSHVLSLEEELERRGTLARDLVEELKELRRAGRETGAAGDDAELEAALERAMAAEASRAEAQFQIDELMGRLAHVGEGADGAELEELRVREAQLSGTVRGLRSRLAEVEEMRELAEGRLAVSELDHDELLRRNLALERQNGQLREQLELELVRAHPPEAAGVDARATEHEHARRLGELSGKLVACRDVVAELTEERDHARADSLRLNAVVGSLEHRYDGARRGYERRIAELEHDARVVVESELRALGSELATLRGERDGLRARLDDREIALASRGDGTPGDSDRVRHELTRLQREGVDLAARAADAEQRAQREMDRAAELAANTAVRDALVTRLQMDLAQEENSRRDLSERITRAQQENDRLRGALVDASERVDESIAAEDTKEALARDARQANALLAEIREVLASLASILGQPVPEPRHDITSAGMEAPDGAVDAGAAARADALADQATLIRSLTAQVEDRDDRLRALERRLEGAVGVEGDEEALRRELMELQERAARLSDELLHERKARRAAESEARKRTGASEEEVRRLHERLGQSDAELLLLKGQHATTERRLESIREACNQARNGLEELLGAATSNGDPTTAERLGTLIRLLNRF